MTSTERSVMRLASSWMVITSGMMTSRMTLSRGCTTPAWRSFSRSRRRFSEASERSRCASSKALLMVSLMRSRFSSPILTGVLVGLAPFFLLRASSSTSGSSSRARPLRLAICCSPRLAGSATLAFSSARALTSAAALSATGRLGLLDRLGDRRLRHGDGRGLDLDGLRLGLGPQCLQADALGFLGLGALARQLQRAATRIELVGGQAAGPLHDLGQQTIRLRLRHRIRAFRAGAGDGALLLLLDHHRLRAAMAEVLPDVAGLDRPLQAQRLARRIATQSLLGGLFRLSHARPVIG